MKHAPESLFLSPCSYGPRNQGDSVKQGKRQENSQRNCRLLGESLHWDGTKSRQVTSGLLQGEEGLSLLQAKSVSLQAQGKPFSIS